MVDPDPRVSGYGLQYLRDNGILVDMAHAEETAACRSLNAPFVFRMQTNRAYAVVLTSIDENDSICNPLQSSTNKKFVVPKIVENRDLNDESNEDESINFSSIVEELSPEINAVVLTSSQFLQLEPSMILNIPTHVAISITVSSTGNQLSDDILEVSGNFLPFFLPYLLTHLLTSFFPFIFLFSVCEFAYLSINISIYLYIISIYQSIY